jgi:hypothetical protein
MRDLIFRLVAENRTWGAPRIHGELKMLGFDISEHSAAMDAEGTQTGRVGEAVENFSE